MAIDIRVLIAGLVVWHYEATPNARVVAVYGEGAFLVLGEDSYRPTAVGDSLARVGGL